MAKARKVTVVTGVGEFADANHLAVRARRRQIAAPSASSEAIIAAGSQSVKLLFLRRCRTSASSRFHRRFAAAGEIPKKMPITRGGIIGLEMGTVYSTLGARLDVVEMLDGLMQGADRDPVKVWQKKNAGHFDNIMLKTKTVGAQARKTASTSPSRARARRRNRSATTQVLAPGRAQRQEDRCRQGGRGRPTAFHRGRSPDAHQRAAHLGQRRHRRPVRARTRWCMATWRPKPPPARSRSTPA